MTEVFVVGKYIVTDDGDEEFAIEGIFETEMKAVIQRDSLVVEHENELKGEGTAGFTTDYSPDRRTITINEELQSVSYGIEPWTVR